jgi:hypothetical protein
MTSVLNDIYSKLLAQENDISKEINRIINNSYSVDTIDRVKEKIKDSLENYQNSINLLNISIEKSKMSNDEKEIWKRKADVSQESYNDLNKRIDRSVYDIKKKNKKNDYKFNLDKENLELGRNISNLQREQQSLNSTIKLSTEAYYSSINVNNELSNQILSLSNIGGKVTNIFQKITGSYNDSSWIKQRGQNDKYICLAMGTLTIIIIGFTYFYLRPKIRGG